MLRPRQHTWRQCPKWAVSAEKYRLRPSLVKSGKQKGGQYLSERVDELVCHVLCAGTERVSQAEAWYEGRWPAKATAPDYGCAAWFAVRPVGCVGGAGCGSCAHARAAHAHPRE